MQLRGDHATSRERTRFGAEVIVGIGSVDVIVRPGHDGCGGEISQGDGA